MRLTWFGGAALRIHIGGEILVSDPDGAADGVNRTELVSGADKVFSRSSGLPTIDPGLWQPRRPVAVIDETGVPPVLVHAVAPGSVLVEAVGEPPLLLLGGDVAGAGRWTNDAVVVAFDPLRTEQALAGLRPRLIALAFDGIEMDTVIGTLRDRLGGTSLMALERGLAVEV